MTAKDKRKMDEMGIKDPFHQSLLMRFLPCGIERFEEALEDCTPVQTNAPRALAIVHWKGMVTILREVERR